jgi:uncharacterized protein (DUF58 family)
MPETKQPVQNPEIFAKISALKLYARDLVEGLLSGQHRSHHKGSSVEFSEYKDYSPGDEIRHIDWKVAGKTDKYHVKQFEQSTNLKCTILLDASASMGYISPAPAPGSEIAKMDYARNLAAAMAYLMLRQFDAVGLVLFNEHMQNRIPPRSKPSHFQHLLHGLAAFEPAGNTCLGQTVGELIERLPPRSLLILISDLLARDDDILKNLRLLAARNIEVLLFHVLHPDEVQFPFEGNVVFESLEDDPPLAINAHDIRQAYQEAVRDLIESFRRNCPVLGIDYLLLETRTPLEQALSYYLLRRKALTKK